MLISFHLVGMGIAQTTYRSSKNHYKVKVEKGIQTRSKFIYSPNVGSIPAL